MMVEKGKQKLKRQTKAERANESRKGKLKSEGQMKPKEQRKAERATDLR
jgi:hypothetical protein